MNTNKKKCYKCGIWKPRSEFHKNSSRKDGLTSRCKECACQYRKQRYQKNKEKAKQYCKQYRQKNKERMKQYYKRYYQENKERIKQYGKQWRPENREKSRRYKNNRYKLDINFRLSETLRNRLYIAIKNNQKTGSAIKDLGCSIEELKKHLEAQFKEGMSWDNYGEWHIDHIIPLSSFDLTNREQFLKACHYTNLQPLWAEENLSKSNKILEEMSKEL